jgi:amino acid permease
MPDRPGEDDAMTQQDESTTQTDGGSHHQSLNAEQVGYKQTLSSRHVQMIAIGGAIGTGLFLGSASTRSSEPSRSC